eukprot:TRINITY_DN1213_c0_g1_i1.p1 TRINITY_DN1213_c0_g1~~TRINITY_DN1213_c0_g1_i1.p1  ORF type:complete len:143 (-),score=1.24 TRINITY_DN1213_c0_g1_i1:329-757(-)
MSTCLTSNVIQQHGVVKTTRSCVRDKIRRHPNSQYRANPYAFSFLSFDNSRLTIEDLLIRATIVLNRSKSFKAARLFLTINFRPQALLSHFFATSARTRPHARCENSDSGKRTCYKFSTTLSGHALLKPYLLPQGLPSTPSS